MKWKEEPGDNKEGIFRYVYDCGSTNKAALKHSVNAMLKRYPKIDALFVSHLHEDHVDGLDQLLGSLCTNTVFIPHLSRAATVAGLVADAVDGTLSHSLVEASLDPEGWFGQRGVSRIVRVQPSPGEETAPDDGDPRYADISWEPSEARDAHQSMESGKMLAPGSGAKILDWVLVPHVDQVGAQLAESANFRTKIAKVLSLQSPEVLTAQQLAEALFAKFETDIATVLRLPDLDTLTAQQLAEALRNPEQRRKLRNCYTNCFGAGHNRVSMSVYSGPKSNPEKQLWNYSSEFPFRHPYYWGKAVGWIGTGDAHLNDDRVRNVWKRSYNFFGRNLFTLLLPHHGSDHNFSRELLKYRNLANYIASAGESPQYPHPGVEVVESVRLARRIFHHVSERPGTLFCETVRSVEDSGDVQRALETWE